MSISSKTVDIPPTTLSVNVLNVVSRIIKLEDATSGSGTPITGYARIYIDGDNNGPYTINSDANGEIKIQTRY